MSIPKKSSATITFHASHNYGSMLQAYALQQVVESLGVENEIINLRPEAQRGFYSHPSKLQLSADRSLLGNCHQIIKWFQRGPLITKYNRFEAFMIQQMKLTQELSSADQLKALANKYDYYITGSDQCWNTVCFDFDWAYYLNFTDSSHKISYASSFGPHPHIDVRGENHAAINSLAAEFKILSVRESGSADFLNEIGGLTAQIMPDPTLLLSGQQWSAMAGDQPIVKGDYIFVYAPFPTKELYAIARQLSHHLGMRIVLSHYSLSRHTLWTLFDRKTIYKLDSGPIEFLNLMKNARCVVSGSFHAVVFSILLQRPFWAIDGNKDNRCSHLMNLCSLGDRSINLDTLNSKIDTSLNINFDTANETIASEREKALKYLRIALDIDQQK